MSVEIRPGAVKARDYDGHFRAVAHVTVGYASRKVQVHPRAWPSRAEAVKNAISAIQERRGEIIAVLCSKRTKPSAGLIHD